MAAHLFKLRSGNGKSKIKISNQVLDLWSRLSRLSFCELLITAAVAWLLALSTSFTRLASLSSFSEILGLVFTSSIEEGAPFSCWITVSSKCWAKIRSNSLPESLKSHLFASTSPDPLWTLVQRLLPKTTAYLLNVLSDSAPQKILLLLLYCLHRNQGIILL